MGFFIRTPQKTKKNIFETSILTKGYLVIFFSYLISRKTCPHYLVVCFAVLDFQIIETCLVYWFTNYNIVTVLIRRADETCMKSRNSDFYKSFKTKIKTNYHLSLLNIFHIEVDDVCNDVLFCKEIFIFYDIIINPWWNIYLT